jgi:hypothetical protein
MRKTIAIAAWALLLVVPASGRAQTENSYRYYCEGYVFFGRRMGTPDTSVAGLGGDVFLYKGLVAGGDFGTTVGNPDNRITIGSAGASYHFLRSRTGLKVEPFLGAGFSYLAGNVNAHGVIYPGDSGQDRTGHNFSQGLIAWPTKHVGVRFEVREYSIFVSYGALENVIPGSNHVEFRIGLTLR